MTENNQVLRVAGNNLYRVVSSSDAVRFNGDAGGKPVLNFTVVQMFGSKDDEDPIWIDVALWGDLATRFNGVIDKGQVCRIDSQLEIYLDTYKPEDPKLKGRISANNGYQFVLMPETLKGNSGDSGPAPEVAPKDITGGSKKNNKDVPF